MMQNVEFTPISLGKLETETYLEQSSLHNSSVKRASEARKSINAQRKLLSPEKVIKCSSEKKKRSLMDSI